MRSSLKNNSTFLWGSATSAYQVEGGNIWSDWETWEKDHAREQCGQAVNHYEMYEKDFSLAKQLNQNAHRLSFEWARVEPRPGNFSIAALNHYGKVLEQLRLLDIKICLTLNHFTLPTWLAKLGGWENEQTIWYFNRFVNLIVDSYGPLVDLWITINEPLVLATEGYLYGHWPPQKKSHRRLVSVVKNLCQAHNSAYRLIHNRFPEAPVGLAHNFFSLEPYRPWFLGDKWAGQQADRFWNQWIMDLTVGHHDFLGVNYYFHQLVFLSFNYRRGFVSFADPKKISRETSALGWEINPKGLTDVLQNLWQTYGLPLYVTENGLAAKNDDQQSSFIVRSVEAMQQAIRQGVLVKGYFYWSLLDNFEWDKGFEPKFGLVSVKRDDWTRHLKPAALVYAKICQRQ